MNGELESGHQATPQGIAPWRYADLLDEHMTQVAFGKTCMPGKFSEGHLPGQIFFLYQLYGGLDPRVNRHLGMLRIASEFRHEFSVNRVRLPAGSEKITGNIDAPPQPLEESAVKNFDMTIPQMPLCDRSSNRGFTVNKQVDLGIAGTEQLVGPVRADDDTAAFDGGFTDPQPKEPIPVHYDLQGMMHVLAVVDDRAQIQKVARPEIHIVFSVILFHKSLRRSDTVTLGTCANVTSRAKTAAAG